MIGLFFMKLWVLSALNTTEAFNPAPGARFSLDRTVLNFEGVGNSEIYSAASACLEEECSVDTVDMLVAQRAAEPGGSEPLAVPDARLSRRLKRREGELAKTGRLVDYEREATLAGVRKMIADLEGPTDPNDFVLVPFPGRTPPGRRAPNLPRACAGPEPSATDAARSPQAIRAAFDVKRKGLYA